MGRVTKFAVIDDIRARAIRLEEEQGFDRRTGTAQLLPPGADETTKALIDRAVKYGRWRALERVAEDIDEGQLGKGMGKLMNQRDQKPPVWDLIGMLLVRDKRLLIVGPLIIFAPYFLDKFF
ncbi:MULTISPECIES: hypothetical protein [Delftia]|uniref:Uncharacterized protein n=1 Tax=Delftia lacustris TaxID=558537 RepID=A0A1H3MU55_9BURK|nr:MULTISPECIES: hypothetical protein [Delftia]QPS78364.1 hypothetical protein I6G48_32105 [Delftia acidovorans]QPS84924.1 hypothetical protein I6G47_32780 [Delftia lacustris]SDY79990.1 hypothetical protein SAMN05421547_10838 [Delftia lacustris]